jgi:G3E family GTPase
VSLPKVPFTILTGWLGAGKTTALNRMLGATHGKRIAVLVNELGRISIDTQLILSRGSDVLELAGGCVCCKLDLKTDLWDGIADIITRSRPDHVVLETTGIAEPAAILEGLVRSIDHPWRERKPGAPLLTDLVVPAGVVCVVYAATGAAALSEREEARGQAQAADRVLLAKLDVASSDAVRRCHAQLDELAPHAERASFPSDATRALTAWLLEARKLHAWTMPSVDHGHGHSHAHGAHHHANQLIAVTFTDDAPLVGERVLAVALALGDRLVRAKGFVHLAGDDRRGFLERAGLRTELRHEGVWGTAPRRTELVLIGDDLDEAALHRALWACRAGS